MAEQAELHVVSEPRSEHVTPMEVAAYIDGAAAPDVRARISAHLSECADCRDEIVDATRIAATLPKSSRLPHRVWIPAAIAAALVFILIRPDAFREPGSEHREAPVTTTVLPRPVTPVGTVDSLPALRWTSVPNADRYQVRVFSADGSVLWEHATTDTTATVPAAIVVLSGRSYYWKVEAQTGFSRSAASELIEFSVRYPQRR